MTKSEIFKSAHKLARKVVSVVGNYMCAFKFALQEIYKKMNQAAEISAAKIIADQIEYCTQEQTVEMINMACKEKNFEFGRMYRIVGNEYMKTNHYKNSTMKSSVNGCSHEPDPR